MIDSDIVERGFDDPDLTGDIERDDAERAPKGFGLPIQRGLLAIGNLGFDTTTVARLWPVAVPVAPVSAWFPCQLASPSACFCNTGDAPQHQTVGQHQRTVG